MISSKTKAALAAGVILAISAVPAFADVTIGGGPGGQLTSVESILNIIFSAILGLSGSIALVLLAIGGIQYMTSGGDKIAVEQARGRITAAVVGLLIVLGAWLIITVVGKFLGFSVLDLPEAFK